MIRSVVYRQFSGDSRKGTGMRKNNSVRSLVFFGAMIVGGTVGVSDAQACQRDSYVGSICYTAGGYCPSGYAEANGQLMEVVSNQLLFATIGCAYGGDCQATFALPDLRGRAPVHVGTGPGLQPVGQGQSFGAQSQEMSVEQMPSHSHAATFTPDAAFVVTEVEIPATTSSADKQVPGPTYNLASVSGTYFDLYSSGDTDTNLMPFELKFPAPQGTVAVGMTGQGASFYTQSPSLGMRACINTDGVFPPRN